MRIWILTLFITLISACSPNIIINETEAVSPTRLKEHVKALVHDKEIRNYKNIAELNRVAEYIKKQFSALGLPVEIQKFSIAENAPEEYKNVVARLDMGKEKDFVLGAHYDVAGWQEGADDNASGVAGMLEIARLLVQNKNKLNYNIEFVAYTLEEPPFFATEKMGSYVHISQKTESQRNAIAGMISIEMIGYFSTEEIQDYPVGLALFYPAHGNFIAAVSNFGSKWISDQFDATMTALNKMDVQKLAGPASIPGVDFSDHRNYWAFNIDAIMITDTAFNRNKNYHKVTDTIDTLNFKKMAWVVEGIIQMFLGPEFH